ncbi:hypothetical protein CVT25_011858 [Psilocybe cyanescens]|uniref:Uncharacterized protein n=1 Tax=Psilocybe cyanescens TaxID=93625 RepID=A0A409WIX2_PSICY|nr:hypothetical protein CVT25_011858 [Psilocybe cyanescens]
MDQAQEDPLFPSESVYEQRLMSYVAVGLAVAALYDHYMELSHWPGELWWLFGIVIFRISSMFHHSRTIIIVLSTAFFTEVLSTTLIQALSTPSGYSNTEILIFERVLSRDAVGSQPFPLCATPLSAWWSNIFWVIVILYEIFLLSLSIFKAVQTRREVFALQKHSLTEGPSIMYILQRDSIIFPFASLAVCVANFIGSVYFSIFISQISLSVACFATHILGSRLILNLREAYYRPFDHEYSQAHSTPITFTRQPVQARRIVIFRLSSMFHHSRTIITFLSVAFSLQMLSTCLIQALSYPSGYSSTGPQTFPLCAPPSSAWWSNLFWVVVIVYELSLLGLSVFRGVQTRREVMDLRKLSLTGNPSIMFILLRDSILFPFVALAVCVANFMGSLYFSVSLLQNLSAVFFLAQMSLSVACFATHILGSRLILNLREAYYRPFDHEYSQAYETPIAFSRELAQANHEPTSEASPA